MDDLRQDSQTGLPTEQFALCSEYFEASCFSRSVLIGTTVDFKRFYLDSVPWQRFSTINIREAKRFIGHWLPKKWGKTCKSIFPKKRSLNVSLGPYRETSVSKIPSPSPKKLISFRIVQANSTNAFDIPRWQNHDLVQQDGPILKLYRVQLRHAKLKSTTNYQLQKSIFLGVRETSQDKTPSSQRL